MHARRSLYLLALASALAVLPIAAVACGGGGGASAGATSADGAAQSGAGGEPTEIVVSMTDNAFNPKEITVPAGRQITFVAKNDGQAIHNMHILSKNTEGKDFQSAAIVNPGDKNEFTATFSKKGKVKFQCDLHLPDMVGTITAQ
jgi:plastocyanin